ncbi:MAG: hypothetical protein EBU88_13960 [Acidobacteria bacterium]|nr:hypothetical protein [Acidobacteriota bacterium]
MSKVQAQGNALGTLPDTPSVLKECRIFWNDRLELEDVYPKSMRRSFRTPEWDATSTQGCTLGWYAAPRWGASGNAPFWYEMPAVWVQAKGLRLVF